MDTIRQQLERIQGQLGGLSASQKMLTGSLIAIMVITVMWWSSYASTGEYQPLLDGAMTPQEMAEARTALTGAGIEMKVDGDRILVPAEKLDAAVAALGYANAMPGNAAESFDKMVEKMSAWDPAFKTKEFFAEAKRRKLESIILVDRNITHADVVFDLNKSTRIGQRSSNSATVSVWTRDGNVKADRGLVEGLANIVAGAVNELAPGDVRVNVNGRLQRVDSGDDHFAGSDLLFEKRAMFEAVYADKIYDTFADIPKILVSVTAQVNATKQQRKSVTYNQDGTVIAPISESTSTTNSTDGAAGSEPGAVPNVGLELAAGGNGGGSSDSEMIDTQNEVKVGEELLVEETAAGEAKVVRAVVRVPLSHIRRDFLARNPDVETPDGAMLATHEENELARIRSILMNVVAIDTQASISVETYADQLPEPGTAVSAGMTLPGGMTVGSIVTTYGREAVIGLLAVVSLFMVSMMVRKASPTITTDVPDLESALAQLRGESVIGEVGESDSLMDAQEMDPETLRTKQMVEQVQNLVGENPEAAAALIRRWVQD